MRTRDDKPDRHWFRVRSWSRSRFNPLAWVLGAAAAGGVAVGLLFLLQMLFGPASPAETAGYEAFQGERFRLWYVETSSAIEEREAFEAELIRELAEIGHVLAVSDDQIPGSIDVFVHDSTSEMQQSLRRREAFKETELHEAAIDVVVGESPRQQLVELVLYFGWGQNYSQAVYVGLLRYVIEPDEPFLLTVKAAPANLRHSLDDLCYLEEIGSYAATAYQQLTGPMAPADVLSFLGTRNLIAMPESISSGRVDDFHEIEMASLVAHLAGVLGGVDRLKSIWGPGDCATVLAHCGLGWGVAELEASWQRAVEDSGNVEDLGSYKRAELLFEAGNLEAAYEMTRDWFSDAPERSLGERAFAARAALAVGALEDASAWVSELDEGLRAEYEALIGIYSGWQRIESPDIVVNAPAEEFASGVLEQRIRATYGAMTERVGASFADQGIRPIFFVYPDVVARNIGSHIGPDDPKSVSSVHLVLDEDWGFDMTEALLPRLWGWWPASPLVRVGIVMALSTSYDALVSAGRELACSGNWFPFESLAATLGDVQTLRTEAGLLFAFVERQLGLDGLREFWCARRGREMASLEGALQSHLGVTRQELEQTLLRDVLGCE